MSSHDAPIEIVQDFVETNRNEDPQRLMTSAEFNAIKEAQAHAERVGSVSLAELGHNYWHESGRKHVPSQLHRKLGAVTNTMVRAYGGVQSGAFQRELIFDLGEDETLGAYVNEKGAVDESGTTMWKQMGLAVIEKGQVLTIGYLRDVQYPNYLQLNRYHSSDSNYSETLDIPIRGDHVLMDEATGRIEGFKDGLHENAQAALSVLDLIKVDAQAIDATPHHWGPLEVVE